LIESLKKLFHLLRHWHENDRLIAFGATPAGRAIIFIFALLLLFGHDYAKFFMPLLALFMLLPQHRNLILSFGGLLYIYTRVFRRVADSELWPASLVAAFLITLIYLVYLAAKNFDKLPKIIRRFSQTWLHTLFIAILIFVILNPNFIGGQRISNVIAVFLPFLLWRCGYMLMSGKRGHAQKTTFLNHFFYLWPIYGGTNVPYGKGHDYLSQNASQNPEACAKSQLSGIKLLILWRFLQFFNVYFNCIFYGKSSPFVPAWLLEYSLGLPRFGKMLSSYDEYSIGIYWSVMFLSIVSGVLKFAILGHVIIGCLRLFGFNVFRNTYKPLLSQTILEFWNRYYYYFKELLVEFFFFPIYLSFSKVNYKIRLFLATFGAAFFGNMYYHVLRDSRSLANMGLKQAWTDALASRTVYCLLLATGIYISMLRERNRRGKDLKTDSLFSRSQIIVRIIGVVTFFAIINVWNVNPGLSFSQRIGFLLSLFGL